MKNKEIAIRVGTTEQVVKNYLRKVYDKLGVADRLELALYCLSHHVVDGVKPPPVPTATPGENQIAPAIAAHGAAAGAAASPAAVSSSVPSSTNPAPQTEKPS
jgi:hypothetical protein